MPTETLPLSDWFQEQSLVKFKSVKPIAVMPQPSKMPSPGAQSERRGTVKIKLARRTKSGKYVRAPNPFLRPTEGAAPTVSPTEFGTLPKSAQRLLALSRQFPKGMVISLAGQPVARVVPISPKPAEDGEWTPLKNQRRCELVDRKLDRTITPEELAELEALTQQMRAFVRSVAPRPLDEIRQLHQELLEEAARRRAGS